MLSVSSYLLDIIFHFFATIFKHLSLELSQTCLEIKQPCLQAITLLTDLALVIAHLIFLFSNNPWMYIFNLSQSYDLQN